MAATGGGSVCMRGSASGGGAEPRVGKSGARTGTIAKRLADHVLGRRDDDGRRRVGLAVAAVDSRISSPRRRSLSLAVGSSTMRRA